MAQIPAYLLYRGFIEGAFAKERSHEFFLLPPGSVIVGKIPLPTVNWSHVNDIHDFRSATVESVRCLFANRDRAETGVRNLIRAGNGSRLSSSPGVMVISVSPAASCEEVPSRAHIAPLGVNLADKRQTSNV